MSKKAAVIYATHGGNAELVAEAIADGINSSDIDTYCIKAELTKAEDLVQYDCIVLVCSTYDVGHLNDKMIRLNLELVASGEIFKGKEIEVVGLGDSENYDIFNGAADILEITVSGIGAIQKMETVKINGNPHKDLRKYKNWGEDLAKLI
ncbi:MAG: flavodoxin family protein [Candidatus Dojkabacteria bacterium]